MKKMIFHLLIGLFLFSTMFTSLSEQSLAEHQSHSDEQRILVRIYTNEGIPSLPSNTEIISGFPDEYLDVITTTSTLLLLSEQDADFTIRSMDLFKTDASIVDTYPTFEEIEEHLQTVASNYPSITELFSIGQSYENRELWCLEISDNPGVDEQEPEVLFMGLHHAREWPTVAITLSLIDELVESYELDENISELVDQRRIWVIPCVNPDGYHYDHDQFNGDKWWRKNRHFFPEFNLYGVDLNRNYGGACNGNPLSMWGSTGISHHPESALYCGTEPFSELEIQHIKHFFLNHTIDASISWHTHGELVLWPWGYSTDDHTPDDEYMGQIGRDIAKEIGQIDGSGSYFPTQSSGLYPTAGDTTDWFYGYSHYILGRPHFTYTIEACDEFHPDEMYLDQVCKENIEGAMVLLEQVDQIDQAPRRVLSPLVTDINNLENNSLLIFWQEQNPEANLDRLAVEQLSGYSVFVDQVLNEEDYWALTDFNLNSERVHSGYFSFHSHIKDNQVSAMTSRSPIFVTDGMKLSFWCYYEIENNYDYAFVEVSTNGRTYTKLDSFTGDSAEWIFKEYDLAEYAGQSIFIRFRYYTDEATHEDGFWVDDIYPTSTFESETIIADDISSSPFVLSKNSDDSTSFFRVKGYNDAYQWGDYSQLYQLSEFSGNSIPTVPVISGEIKGKTDQTYTYTIRSIDLDQDELFYQVQWGDDNQTEWIGPYQSGDSISIDYSWSDDGTYLIKARAKDEQGAISEWGELQVQMPYVINYPLFYRIQQIIQWILSFM